MIIIGGNTTKGRTQQSYEIKCGMRFGRSKLGGGGDFICVKMNNKSFLILCSCFVSHQIKDSLRDFHHWNYSQSRTKKKTEIWAESSFQWTPGIRHTHLIRLFFSLNLFFRCLILHFNRQLASFYPFYSLLCFPNRRWIWVRAECVAIRSHHSCTFMYIILHIHSFGC